MSINEKEIGIDHGLKLYFLTSFLFIRELTILILSARVTKLIFITPKKVWREGKITSIKNPAQCAGLEELSCYRVT